MTVEKLIFELNKIEDKTKNIFVEADSWNYRTDELEYIISEINKISEEKNSKEVYLLCETIV